MATRFSLVRRRQLALHAGFASVTWTNWEMRQEIGVQVTQVRWEEYGRVPNEPVASKNMFMSLSLITE